VKPPRREAVRSSFPLQRLRFYVPTPIDPQDSNFDQANSQLSDGLRSCRTVVSNYRALLAGDADEGLGNAGFNDNDARDQEAAD
jgi:hypothetical protein